MESNSPVFCRARLVCHGARQLETLSQIATPTLLGGSPRHAVQTTEHQAAFEVSKTLDLGLGHGRDGTRFERACSFREVSCATSTTGTKETQGSSPAQK